MAAKRAGRKKATRKRAPRVKPSKYGRGVAEELCTRLAGGVESLTQICQDEHMPTVATVLRWRADDDDFRGLYDQARAAKAERLVDDAVEIADDRGADYVLEETETGVSVKLNTEAIQRSRLRVETRKWAASKYAPRTYGDRQQLDVGGQEDNPLTFADLAREAAGR